MIRNKNLFKNSVVNFIAILTTCLFTMQTFAMQKSQVGLLTSRSEWPAKKSLPEPDCKFSTAPEKDSPMPVSALPVKPESSDLIVMNTYYNTFNNCRTLGICPGTCSESGYDLFVGSARRLLGARRQEILNYFDTVNPRFEFTTDLQSSDIMEIFDVVVVDKRIKTYPAQLLDHQKWLIFRRQLNATIYINKNYLSKRVRECPGSHQKIIDQIICYALYDF